MILLLIVGFFVMMMLGIPVAFSMLGSSLLYIIVGLFNGNTLLLTTAIQRMEIAVDSFPLMAIPFFVLAGEFMNTGGITRKIMDFARACVGLAGRNGSGKYFCQHIICRNVRLFHSLCCHFRQNDDPRYGKRRL